MTEKCVFVIMKPSSTYFLLLFEVYRCISIKEHIKTEEASGYKNGNGRNKQYHIAGGKYEERATNDYKR